MNRIRLSLVASLLIISASLSAQTHVQRVYGSGCAGTDATFIFTNGSCVTSWSAPGGQITSQTSSQVNVRYNSPGTYSVSATFSGCSSSPSSGTEFSANYTVVASVTPSVSITGTSTICQGSSVTFTATPTNGGSSPTYAWKVNGATVYNGGNTFTTTSLANGNVVTSEMTPSISCVTSTSVTSNAITMTVNTPLPLSASISSSGGMPFCGGAGSFGATAINATNPTYTWYRNGLPANNRATGTPANVYSGSTAFSSGDVITCVVSSSGCVSGSPATSNAITVSTTTPVTPAISVGPSSNLCAGSNMTFTASPGSSGYTLSNFSWQLNNASVPGNTNTLTTNQFTSGSTITVSATASGSCLSSNTATGTTAQNIPIEQNPNAAISPSGSLTISSTSSQTITASPSSGYNYSWTKNSASVGSNASTYTTNQSGVYAVSLSRNGCNWPSSSLTLTVNSKPTVTITSGNQTITLPTSSVTLSGTGSDSDGSIAAYSWAWVSGPKTTTFSNQTSASTLVNGLTIPGSYVFQLAVTDNFGESAYSNLVTITVVLPLNNYNWVSEQNVMKYGVTTAAAVDALAIGDKTKTIHYFDDLGRDWQTVGVQSSVGHRDVVQPIAYDNDGRVTTTYLPYIDGASTDGSFKVNALADPSSTGTDVARYHTGAQYLFYQTGGLVASDAYPYSLRLLEASPLNRTLEQGAPGAAFQPDAASTFSTPTSTDHSVKFSYEINDANEVLQWTYAYPVDVPNLLGLVNAGTASAPAYYPAGKLQRQKSKDEHNNQVIEYKDNLGHVVLKRVQAVAGSVAVNDTNYASTYYIYDDFNNLVCVIPPEAVSKLATQYYQSGANNATKDAFLSAWAFRYTYDERGRMSIKQVPGASPVYMVYDGRDRLVLTQDGNQRTTKQWLFTKYDQLNRPVLTGIIKTNVAVDQAGMQARLNTFYASAGATSYYEVYQGTGVHGYTNNSYPQTDTLNNYLTVAYYDTYDFKSLFVNNGSFDYDFSQLNGTDGYQAQDASANSLVTGQVTGTKTRLISAGSWLKTVNYYDSKYRLIQQIADNIKGHTITTTAYDFAGRPQSTKTSLFTGQPITWANITGGASTSGNNISFNGTGSDWSQGATSVQYLPANTDGWIEATLSQANVGFILGVGDSGVPAIATVDFGWYVGTGQLNINRGNNIAYGYGNVVSGDVLRIERINGKIYFKKNGVIVYPTGTQTADVSTVQLYFYTTLKNAGAKIANVVVSNTFSGSNAAVSTVSKRFTYDHASRLTGTWHKIGTRSGGSITETTEVLLASNTYNELGQLVDKKLHSTTSAAVDAKQSVDYRYNIRGWLTSINNAELSNIGTNDDLGDLFGMNLAYNDDLGTGNSANLQYNGNINAIKWSSGLGRGSIKAMAYNFNYDPMNRLLGASHKQANTLNTWTTGQYDENGLSYDLNGNIKTLQRKGKGNVLIDNLSYTYASSGNQLMLVGDAAAASDKDKGFYDGNTSGNDYAYDANGNMIQDKNKNLILSAGQSITYNHLNLPEKVTKYGTNGYNDNIVYLYDATGAKQSQIVTQIGTQKVTEYVGPWVFENNVLQFVQHDEGRIVIANEQKLYSNSCDVVTADMTVVNANAPLAQTINGEKYVKISTASAPAGGGGLTFSNVYTVVEGERYLYRVKGYFNGVPATLYAKGNSADLLSPGTSLPKQPLSEAWVEETIVIPTGVTQLTLGVRWKDATTNDYFLINEVEFYKLGNTAAPEYQYHLKDHLGNVRVTFTTQNATQNYTAGFETANQTTEATTFRNYPSGGQINTLPSNAHSGTNSEYLNGGYNGQVGIAKSFSVMPGDVVQVQGYANYTTPSSTAASFTNFAASLLSAFSLPTPGMGETGTAASGVNAFANWEIGSSGDENKSDAMKVFITIVLFDKNYNFIDVAYKASTSSGTLISQSYTVKEPGYAYLYISNEHPTLVDVYFDDVMMSVTPNAVIATNDYYPFGLTSQTYSRENVVPNVHLYNGKEIQDELNIGWFDYGARMYMPETGRWGVIDPLTEKYMPISPYAYGLNNPIIFVDRDGRDVIPTLSVNYSQISRTLSSVHELGSTYVSSFMPVQRADGNYDVKVNIVISMNNLFAGGPFNQNNPNSAFNKENPGLHSQVMAHEQGHNEQLKQVIQQDGFKYSIGGKQVTGKLDKVVTSFMKAINKEVNALNKTGFSSAKERDAAQKTIDDKKASFFQSMGKQIDQKMNATFARDGIENNANMRAATTLRTNGEGVNYISGQTAVTLNGKEVPKN